MTTFRMSFGDLLAGDPVASVNPPIWQPASILDTTDLYPAVEVLVYSNTGSTHDKANARFAVPKNYVGTAKIIVRYKTTATSGNTLWTCSYSAKANGETGDPAAADESLAGTATAVPATTNLLKDITFTLTSANLAVDDTVFVTIGRNRAGADTVAASLQLIDAFFEYDDV